MLGDYFLVFVKLLGLGVAAVSGLVEIGRKSRSDRRAKIAIALVLAGFGTAAVAEIFDTVAKRRDSAQALERNTELLKEVQRNLHPLFPLFVNIRFRAPLDSDETSEAKRVFEVALAEARAADINNDVDLLDIHPAEPQPYATCAANPLGYAISASDLDAWVRFYSRSKTAARDFERDNTNFCPCPWLNPYTELGTERAPERVRAASDEEDYTPAWLPGREVLYDSDRGLELNDGDAFVSFDRANSDGYVVSVDDLPGSTLEIETRPFLQQCEGVRDGGVRHDLISFSSVTLGLPGNRRAYLPADKFVRAPLRDELVYRYTFPTNAEEFERLFSTDY